MSPNIPSPEEFFGHRMGADKKLARWDKIVEYFWELDKSPSVKVIELGLSTEGNPFLLAIISSSENIKNIEKIKAMSWNIAHPNGLSKKEIEEIIKNGKTVVSMTNSLHASEVGGTQMSSELAYELATKPEHEEIRNNTVLLIVPSFNPDGNIMVVDWYNKTLGTEYEGTGTPYLYHKYVGHDNNRDAVHNTQVESQMVSQFMYKEWYPQSYIDHHHMGGTGARFYIPPFANPINDKVDPLIWTEQTLYGGMMATMLESDGKTGIEQAATYPGEFMPTFNYIPCWHNICGMLTESASARIATPTYVHYHQLRGSSRGRPEYRTQMGFPHPWEGGWWTLRDIVEQQKISSLACLTVASKHRELILRNMYQKASRNIEKGKTDSPYAFIIKPEQHDELSAYKFMKTIMDMDIKISRSTREFKAEGVTYPRGTYIVFVAQPCRPYIISLLKRTFYHAGPYSFKPDGTPISPYDLCTYTIAEFMGVGLHEVKKSFDGSFEALESIRYPRGTVDNKSNGWLLDCRSNESYAAINRLLRKGIEIHRTLEAIPLEEGEIVKGSFYIPKNSGVEVEVKRQSKRHHLNFVAPPEKMVKTKPVKMLRVGMYHRYRGGNMDEGWTRWLLEQYRFRYKKLMDADIKRGKLINKYDVIILPSDSKQMITGEGIEEYYKKRFGGARSPTRYPKEYETGIGKEGLEKLKEFVEAGGLLVNFAGSSDVAIELLELPIKNAVKDISSKEYLCPGSTLRVDVNYDNALTEGIQDDLLIIFRNNTAFEIAPGKHSENMDVVLSFPEQQIMESGWLIGEKYLSRKAAMIDVKKGKGRAILFGFSPIFRAQSDSTFKLFFNCLYG